MIGFATRKKPLRILFNKIPFKNVQLHLTLLHLTIFLSFILFLGLCRSSIGSRITGHLKSGHRQGEGRCMYCSYEARLTFLFHLIYLYLHFCLYLYLNSLPGIRTQKVETIKNRVVSLITTCYVLTGCDSKKKKESW